MARTNRMTSALLALGPILWGAGPAAAQELPLVQDVAAQPLAAQAQRVMQALDLAGHPLD